MAANGSKARLKQPENGEAKFLGVGPLELKDSNFSMEWSLCSEIEPLCWLMAWTAWRSEAVVICESQLPGT